MTRTIIPVDDFDLVVFGATGDLALRKLFPALFQRDADGQMPDDARIIGLSLSDNTDDEFRQKVDAALKLHIKTDELNPNIVERFSFTPSLSFKRCY